MLSKNNFNEKLMQMNNQKAHFSIRKLTIGAASVLIGITFMGINGQTVNADEMTGNTQPEAMQVSTDKSTDATTTQQNDSDSSAQKNAAQTVEVPQNSKQDNTGETSQSTTDKKDTQVQKTESSETKADTAQSQVPPAANQTQKSADQNVENTQSPVASNTTQPKTQNDSKYNVADWGGSLNDETHEYTLNKYNGSDKENIYIPNTEDFIKAGKITDIDKVFITKDLIQNITKNGATSIVIDDQGSEDKNKVYAKGDWSNAFAGSTKLKSVDLSHLDTSQVTSMAGAFNGDTGLNDANLSGWNIQNMTNLSSLFYGANNLYNVDMSGWNFINNPNTNSMFSYADYNLKSVNLKNAKNVTDDILRIYARAIKNSNATTADLSDINLSPNVTSLHGLFSNMPDLKNVNLSGLDISHITDMGGMFSGDSNLESLDLSGLDLSKVTNTNNMFDWVGGKIKSVNITNTKSIPRSILDIYLKALSNTGTTTVDLSGINLSPNVTSLHGLFANMPNLGSANLSGLDISHITDMGGMFFNDTSLKSVNLSGLNLEKVKDLSTVFYGANNLENVDFSNTKFAPDANTNVMFAFADTKLQSVNINGTKNITREVLDAVIRAAKNSNATTLDLSGVSFSPSITSFNNLFSNMPNIESIDLTGWDTSHITDMSYMFFNDPKLKIIKGLEDFNTSNVTNMAYMFAAFNNPTTDNYDPKGLESLGHLTKLDLSNWDTSNVTNMLYMFAGQTNLTSLGDLSKWNTSKVTNMAYMFYDLKNIDDGKLDLTGWDTSNVTDMSYMFFNMFLQKDLSFVNDWNTGKVTDMSYMFANDKNLEKLDLSKWDVSSVGLKHTEQNYSLAMMFAGDTSLTTVGDISHWNTKNVHDTRQMFYNTPKLTNIDLSGWNTGKLQIAEGMFNSSGAKQINLDNWDLSNIKRITPAGYVEGKAGVGVLRGVENMFKNLTNPAVISMNKVILPDARNAFEINDFEGNKAIVVIANGQNGEALQDLLKINNQTWTDKSGNNVTGRQNSDYVTYVRADDNSNQIGQRGLNFIFTNLDDLHQYFNQVTNADNVKNDIGELSHDWDAQQDTDNNIVKITLRLSPASSYDPYSENIHAEKDGNILADLMTSKYQLHIVAPTNTTETKKPTRTIIIENPDGTTSTKEQTVEFKHEVTKHVDGTEEATSWTPTSGEWTKFDVPQIAGYDSYVDGTQSKSVASEPVNKDTENVTVVITYKSNAVNPEPIIPDPVKPEVDPDKKDPQEPKTDPVTPTPDEPENPKPEKKPSNPDKRKDDNSKVVKPHGENKAAKKNHSSVEHKKTGTHTIKLSHRVAPKGTQATNGSKKSTSTVNKAADNNKNTLPQTGEKKSNAGLIGLALIALASLGLIDRKRRD